AHALAAHGLVRATKDLDVWVRPTRENGVSVVAALQDFGAPLHGLTAEDIAGGQVVFQIGVEPIRIDVLTSIDGVEFDDAWADRVASRFHDQEAFVLSRPRLIQNKRAAGREQDLVDVHWLEKHPAGEP
ncbi:MAG: hypothetical protein AB7S68_25070, partial [Polyangiaceae bacterium]